MKLEGSLDAFSLPDVFQLLSLTKKTGALHLTGDGRDGVVFFAEGAVTGASADTSQQGLARRLIGSGVVGDAALQAAVDRAAGEEGVGVVKALLESTAVEAELLQTAAGDQVVDAVFDLLRWPNGGFAFVVDEANPDDVGVALAADKVLADADARRGTWEDVSRLVPSPDLVPTMPVVLADDPAITKDEWALLALVDGRRTVGDLVDLTGCGQFAVVSTLAGLVERSLLEVRAADQRDLDYVAVVARRQDLLDPLEDVPFTPVAPQDGAGAGEPADGPPAARSGDDPAQPAPRRDGSGAPDVDQLVGAAAEGASMLGGPHVPGDVVPPRDEPFLPKRQPEYAERRQAAAGRVPSSAGGQTPGDTVGATALEAQHALIERDPSVNRSLMLRLIAGVRGL